jgi:hypothetical protein
MLASITPLGERARRQRWSWTAGSYLMSSTVAAGVLGLALGSLGALAPAAPRVRLLLLGAGLLLALGFEVTGRRPPSWRRQVDVSWLRRYRGWVYGAGFGAQLGLGVVTIVTSASLYAVVLAELVSGRAWAGAAIGACFGVARGAPLLLTARTRRPAQLRVLLRRTVALARAGRVSVIGCCAAGALTAGWLAR